MKLLELRDCQKPMVDYFVNHKRGNIFASPGTGKTSATLMGLSCLAALEGDCFPALVVAPLRVANLVWGHEVNEWEQFNGLKVSKIIGNEKQRIKALYSKADIYTINYENLVWLHEQLKDTKWPFRTVIADESTRLKNQRCYLRENQSTGKLFLVAGGGTRNAQALCRHALETKYWYNLTGTPAPNGLEDLWGQQWPVDFGETLGRSFSRFLDKWFHMRMGSSSMHKVMIPNEGAFEEISELLKETSVSIDAYDYFDTDKPIELDVFIALPPHVREQYDELHRASVTELNGQTTVTAVNAGAKIMKCRQMASGCVKDDDGEWRTLHYEKLAAVDEIIESINGENLVIAYWFQHDLQALQNKYPDAVVLQAGKKQQQIVDDWNAGKIKLLLIHAQSAGHGLSLQHGGRHLCIYTQDWNAEYYAQVIERLGTIRQAQSGYNRMAYVHRLIALNTWEEVIAQRQAGKLSMDEAIRKAVAMKLN